MNTQMMDAARQMPQMMSNMMAHPMTGGAMLAAGGYAAGKGLLGGLLRNPLVVLATGVAAGYLLFKYQKEIVASLSKLTGMGKDFVLQQKENLDDLIAEAKEGQADATAAAPAPAKE